MNSINAGPVTAGGFAGRYPGLDPDLAAVLDVTAAAGLPPITTLTPAQARQRVTAGNPVVAGLDGLAAIDDVTIGTDGLLGRRYLPAGPRDDVVIVYFHGGGWVTGDLGYSEPACRMLAGRAGCEVLSVDYRLAPEHPFPAAVEDAFAALCWAAGAGGRRAVVVAGDSAGGNLAAVAALNGSRLGVSVRGQLLIYPTVDDDLSRPSYQANSGIVISADAMAWFFAHYCPDPAHRQDPNYAPLRYADLRGAPPAVVVVAGYDPLRDEGVAYAEALSAAGVPARLVDYPALVHGFLRFQAQSAAATAAMAGIAGQAARLAAGFTA